MQMSPEQILTKLKSTMAEMFGMDSESITESTLIREELDLDSIDFVDLANKLETELDRKISPEEFGDIRTIGDIVSTLYKLLQEQG